MAKVISIKADARERVGKGAARATRRAGFVPAVIYGDNKEPESIQIRLNEIIRLINRGGFLSHTYEIDVDGKKTTVLPRDMQLHPVSDVPMHIDFLRLAKGGTVVMEIPVKVVDEDKCPGLTRGGTINYTRHEIELEVPNDKIPEFVEVSVANVELGDAVKVSAVKLPAGCTPTITDRDFTIVTIAAPSSLKSAEAEADDAEEGKE